MNRFLLSVATVFALTLSLASRADFRTDSIRIVCVPQASFFEIEHRYLRNQLGVVASEAVWKRHGFHSPGVKTSCKFGGSLYKFTSEQDPFRATGFCGAAPPVLISIWRDNEMLVDDVTFGDSCAGEASIARIMFFDLREPGGGEKQLEICFKRDVRNDRSQGSKERCAVILEDWSTVFPLTRGGLDGSLEKLRNVYR